MNQSPISRRIFIYRAAGLALTLWAGRGLAQSPKLPAGLKLEIALEYAAPAGGRYRPPYVAAWVENAQGLPVRELALWYEQSGRGSNWLRELLRWSNQNTNPESTVSGPTRLPGRYSLVWDGKDQKGNPVSQGDYYVCIEMAREHGPYQLFREKLSLASSAFTKTYSPSGELKAVTLAYGQ